MGCVSLTDVFMQRRAELRRYFVARVGEAEADDLLQDAFIKLATVADDSDVQSPGAYVYRLVNNVMLDRLRKQRNGAARDAEWRRCAHMVAPSGEEVFDGVPADEALAARDRLDRVRLALAELPENIQHTFARHKFDGLSHSEVAAELGVSRSLVEKHMMRALKHLIARVGR